MCFVLLLSHCCCSCFLSHCCCCFHCCCCYLHCCCYFRYFCSRVVVVVVVVLIWSSLCRLNQMFESMSPWTTDLSSFSMNDFLEVNPPWMPYHIMHPFPSSLSLFLSIHPFPYPTFFLSLPFAPSPLLPPLRPLSLSFSPLKLRAGLKLKQLRGVLLEAISHVKTCPICQGRGFVCEFCKNSNDIIFPFEANKVSTCRGNTHFLNKPRPLFHQYDLSRLQVLFSQGMFCWLSTMSQV